jgi:DNA polymerase iota
MPSFVFSFREGVDALAGRLVKEAALPIFHKLYPVNLGSKRNLVNMAATNIADAAGDKKTSAGRDIGKMFRSQERVLRNWKVEDRDIPPSKSSSPVWGAEDWRNETYWEDAIMADAEQDAIDNGIEPRDFAGSSTDEITWDSDEDAMAMCDECKLCGALIPHFAAQAHETYHALPD